MSNSASSCNKQGLIKTQTAVEGYAVELG